MWLFLLYSLAALWSLKTLLALMERHKQVYLLKLQQQLDQEQLEQNLFDAIDKKNHELQQERQPPRAA